MKTGSAFKMKKSTKRLLTRLSTEQRPTFKQAMIAAQVASEIRPKTREKKTQGATDE